MYPKECNHTLIVIVAFYSSICAVQCVYMRFSWCLFLAETRQTCNCDQAIQCSISDWETQLTTFYIHDAETSLPCKPLIRLNRLWDEWQNWSFNNYFSRFFMRKTSFITQSATNTDSDFKTFIWRISLVSKTTNPIKRPNQQWMYPTEKYCVYQSWQYSNKQIDALMKLLNPTKKN